MNYAQFQQQIAQINSVLYFDEDDYLREKTTDRMKLLKLIEVAKHFSKENAASRYNLYGIIGNFYRICEKPIEAIVYLERCLTFAREEKNVQKEIVSSIRLGEALKYANEHDKALQLFEKAYTLCKKHDTQRFLDFVLQHQGKCYLELGRVEEAKDCFLHAFKLRQHKNELSLLKSTEQALAFCEKVKR